MKAVRPAIFILTNCQHNHVTCGCEDNKWNVNSGMDEKAERSQEKSTRKAFAPAKAILKFIIKIIRGVAPPPVAIALLVNHVA